MTVGHDSIYSVAIQLSQKRWPNMRIEYSMTIQRPIEEVFAFVSNVENWSQWISNTSEITKTSSGPIGVGTTFTQITHFLGRRLDVRGTVMEYMPNRKIRVQSDGKPVPFQSTITLEPAAGGTHLHDVLEASGDVSALFKIAEPLMEGMVRKGYEKDHETLKDLLEAHAEVMA